MPQIPCHHCEGTGRIELPEHLLATLKRMRYLGECTSPELLASLGEDVILTAISNRLRALETLGFARRRRKGYRHLWSLTAIGRAALEGEPR